MAQFRTATGQTGMDAYICEAAAIANAQRELNERFHRLIDVVREETSMFNLKNGYESTDYMFKPGAKSAESFLRYMQTGGAAGYEERCAQERQARKAQKEVK